MNNPHGFVSIIAKTVIPPLELLSLRNSDFSLSIRLLRSSPLTTVIHRGYLASTTLCPAYPAPRPATQCPMLRRQTHFVNSLLARCEKGASLPECYSQLTPALRKSATTLADEANTAFQKTQRSLSSLDPTAVVNTVFLNLCSGNHPMVLQVAKRVAQHPQKEHCLSLELYLLILHMLAASKQRTRRVAPGMGASSQLSLATQLCLELLQVGCTDNELDTAFGLVLVCAARCDDFTQLVTLRILFDAVSSRCTDDTRMKYFAAVLTQYLNSNQYSSFLEHLYMFQESFVDVAERRRFFSSLPLQRVLEAMFSAHDCANLMLFLENVLNCPGPDLLSLRLWVQALGVGLSLNHYELVKLICDRVLLKGVDKNISVEKILFDNSFVKLLKENAVFRSLSETTVNHVIHTLALHGDVTLCLFLIELYYVHKSLKGERGLSKELRIDIVQAYCFHEHTWDETNVGPKDESVKQVLDVIYNFAGKEKLTYADISDAFLYKLLNYHVYDKNIENFRNKVDAGLARFRHDLDEDKEAVLARMVQSAPISNSSQGSVLMNMETLRQFVVEHTAYVSLQNYGQGTLQTFVNCVLNHMTKYQNLSGLITILEALSTLNKNFAAEWLDSDLAEIIAQCLAASHANMVSGLPLFQYFTSTREITPKMMKCFVYSGLRNPLTTSLLELYMYNFLKRCPGTSSKLLVERIRNWASEHPTGRPLAEFLSSEGLASLDQWISRGFVHDPSQIVPSQVVSTKHSEIDLRDYLRLQTLFK